MLTKRLKYVLIIMLTGLFVLITGFNNSFAEETIRMAVLDFEVNNTSKYAAKAVSEFISTEMAKKSELAIIERTQMGAILNEQGFQQTGCTDQSCAVEMGKLLSAKKILLGTLTKTGTIFTITAKSVDVETGRIDFAESERCTKEEDLELASKILAVKLVNNIAGTSYTIPLRTYQQDESRNRFAIGLLYKYGIMKNVNVPFFKYKGDGAIVLDEDERDIQNQACIISPSYEITSNLGLRIDLKYLFSKFKSIGQYKDDYLSSDYSVRSEVSLPERDALLLENGYGLGLNLQMIYPIDGFNFYIIPGISIDKYKLISPCRTGDFYYYDSSAPLSSYSYTTSFSIDMKTDIYTYIFKLETGFSVYVSRYIDLYFSAGIDYHLFSKLISDVKIVENKTYTTGTVNKNMLENNNSFEGNFPPEYYVQAGIVLRVF